MTNVLAVSKYGDAHGLRGVKVHVDADGAVLFVEDRVGRFLFSCPHCDFAYWYFPDEKFDWDKGCADAFMAEQKT